MKNKKIYLLLYDRVNKRQFFKYLIQNMKKISLKEDYITVRNLW